MKSKDNTKKRKIIICIIIVLFIIIVFNLEKNIGNEIENTNLNMSINEKQEEKNEDFNIYDEDMLNQFIEIGFTNEQAQFSVNTLKKIGINTITSFKEYNINTYGYYDESYPAKEEVDIVYECIGKDNTEFKCNFLMFIKNDEIIHINYYGYGTKTIYYTKEDGVIHKTVHPYSNN